MSGFSSQEPPAGGLGGPPSPQNPYGPIHTTRAKMSRGAVIAIVVASVVALLFVLVGALAVLGITGMRRFNQAAKQAEVRYTLGRMAKQAAAAYENDAADGTVLVNRRLCPSAKGPVPADERAVSGRKYMSTPSEWRDDPGFSCLQFDMTDPQYYQYHYTSDASSMTAIGRSDLDGDGVFSRFELAGRVEDGTLKLSPSLRETNPDE